MQPAFSVLFLSDIGAVWYANPERNSLQAAFQLPVQTNLNGLVVETAELKSQQDQIEGVRDQGLQLLTFGIDNNDSEWVRKQYYLIGPPRSPSELCQCDLLCKGWQRVLCVSCFGSRHTVW